MLDCEIVAIDREEKEFLRLQDLSTRGRNNVDLREIKIEVCIFAFDILYLNGQPLIQEQLKVRREKYGDPTLMRFLIARSMDSEKAAKMFVEWLKWRSTMVPSGFISEAEVPDELEARKVCLQGLSKDQRPLMIVKASKHYPSKDHPQFKKFVVYLLDKVIESSFKERKIGNEKLIGILDLQQMAYKNVDHRGLITGFQFLQAYYPERLGKCYILNMPWFFVIVWRMVSRFLDKATLKKIVIVTNEDEKKELIDEIGVDVLPEEYGGRAKFIAIQDFILTPYES